MGDVEDVSAIAENLELNAREQVRFDLHLEDVKKYAVKANFWAMLNIIWQIIFFWGLVVLALNTGKTYSEQYAPSMLSFFNYMDQIISPMNLFVAIVGPISFFLMIYTGIIRRKWEGKLTRASAYALAFLSNIEHREFMALEDKKDQKREQVIQERKDKLKEALEAGKMKKHIYDQNIKKIEALEKDDKDKKEKQTLKEAKDKKPKKENKK